MKENNEEIANSQIIEAKPIHSDINDQFQDQSHIDAKKYEAMEYGRMLKERTYTVDGKEAKAKSDSKEMSAVLEGLEGLNDVFDMVEFDTSSKATFVNAGMTILDMMKNVASRCDAYLAAKNPWFKEGKVRRDYVRKISERVGKDIIGMEDKLTAYWEQPEEEKVRIKSWTDFLNWERTVNYRNGEDGVTITHTGGGTSDVIVIEQNGKKKFFKKEDKLPPNKIEEVVADIEDEIISENEKGSMTQGSIDYYKVQFLERFGEEFPQKISYRVRFEALRDLEKTNDPYVDLKNALTGFFMYPRGVVADLLERVDLIEEDEKRQSVQKALGDLFVTIRKAFTSAGVGVDAACIDEGENLVKRNVATYKLADMLGIGHLIPKSEMATLEVDGKKMYGVMMDDAEGETYNDLTSDNPKPEYAGKIAHYTAEGFRDCFMLQILDVICGQIDRHELNRMLKLKQGKKNNIEVVGIKGIDSDMSFGNRSYSSILKSFPAFEDKNGLAFPISRDVATAILELDPAVLNYEMMGILNKEERKNLVDRLNGVKHAIKKRQAYEKSHRDEQSLFLSLEGWAEYANDIRMNAKDDRDMRQKYKKHTYVNLPLLSGKKINKPNVK